MTTPGSFEADRFGRRKRSLPGKDGIHLLQKLLLDGLLAALDEAHINQANIASLDPLVVSAGG